MISNCLTHLILSQHTYAFVAAVAVRDKLEQCSVAGFCCFLAVSVSVSLSHGSFRAPGHTLWVLMTQTELDCGDFWGFFPDSSQVSELRSLPSVISRYELMASRRPSLTREWPDSVLFLLKITELLMSFQFNVGLLMTIGVGLTLSKPPMKHGFVSRQHSPSTYSA